MGRLPVPGRDDNERGALRNEFLAVSHREDGLLKGVIEVIKVKDWAAVGNGQTDNTQAIQQAVNELDSQAENQER